MKLQILIPQYNETDDVVKPLLDSIAIQQNVDLSQVGVVICNGGSNTFLSEELLNSYPFKIEYHKATEHESVSATRNACLDKATAEYVMFCDADDMFANVFGLWIIFREIDNGGFDSLVSVFYEETINPQTKQKEFIHRGDPNTTGIDGTFVHGKVHNLNYLKSKDIRWNNDLTIHEDSYFNILCQKLSKNVKFCPTPFYLWKWRDDSVCRRDNKYILKTLPNMLQSNTALVEQFISRGMIAEAQSYATSMIMDTYYSMNCKQWLEAENAEYRNILEKCFKEYYTKFEHLFKGINEQEKNQIIYGIRNRFFMEGLMIESITFDDWIKHIVEEV